MDTKTAESVLQEDLSFLAAFALHLENRLRSAPARYVGVSLAATGSFWAAVRAISGTDPLSAPTGDYGVLWGSLLLVLHFWGAFVVATFSRDRKHYIKILACLNDVRTRAAAALGMEGPYVDSWKPVTLSTWPIDSAATASLAAIVVIDGTYLALVTSMILPIGVAVGLSLVSMAAQVLVVRGISKS